MCRIGWVISASCLASAATLALASCAAAAGPGNAVQAGCTAPGSHTLAVDRVARVFSFKDSVYGCIGATGQRRKLGGAGICNRPAGTVAPVRLAGEIVAYAQQICGVDTGSSSVIVRDLASGKPLADLPASTLPVGPESFVSVPSLVLRKGGAVGWIVQVASIISHSGPTYEVHRLVGGKNSLLDSGRAIKASSLRLVGGRMTWRHGSAKRSAGL